MSLYGIPNGLYRGFRDVRKFGLAKHLAIIDIGNVLQHPGFNSSCAILYHFVPEGLRVEKLGFDMWKVYHTDPILDLNGVWERMLWVRDFWKYDLVSANCEHFVNFVAGEKVESSQVKFVGNVVVFGLYVAALASKEKPANKRRKNNGNVF